LYELKIWFPELIEGSIPFRIAFASFKILLAAFKISPSILGGALTGFRIWMLLASLTLGAFSWWWKPFRIWFL
jgi:hypothetical protein